MSALKKWTFWVGCIGWAIVLIATEGVGETIAVIVGGLLVSYVSHIEGSS